MRGAEIEIHGAPAALYWLPVIDFKLGAQSQPANGAQAALPAIDLVPLTIGSQKAVGRFHFWRAQRRAAAHATRQRSGAAYLARGYDAVWKSLTGNAKTIIILWG
jgi:hypothetical protein